MVDMKIVAGCALIAAAFGYMVFGSIGVVFALGAGVFFCIRPGLQPVVRMAGRESGRPRVDQEQRRRRAVEEEALRQKKEADLAATNATIARERRPYGEADPRHEAARRREIQRIADQKERRRREEVQRKADKDREEAKRISQRKADENRKRMTMPCRESGRFRRDLKAKEEAETKRRIAAREYADKEERRRRKVVEEKAFRQEKETRRRARLAAEADLAATNATMPRHVSGRSAEALRRRQVEIQSITGRSL